MSTEKRYPIKVVSQRSGLSVHVIRAWEKRYHIVSPLRTDTNRRLYSEEDIEKLSLLNQVTASGYSIGSVADLASDALRTLLGKENGKTAGAQFPQNRGEDRENPDYYVQEGLAAIADFDSASLEKILLRASIELTQPVLLEEMIIPLLVKVGELWHSGKIRIMHEHLATAVIRTFLANLRNAYQVPLHAPAVVIATPFSQVHDLAALIIAVVAAAEGRRVIYLGSNLPAEEIAAAAMREHAEIIALSIIYPFEDPKLQQELKKLRSLLHPDMKIVVGGRGTSAYQTIFNQIDIKRLDTITDFRKFLRLMGPPD